MPPIINGKSIVSQQVVISLSFNFDHCNRALLLFYYLSIKKLSLFNSMLSKKVNAIDEFVLIVLFLIGEHSKITLDTKNVFIESTATDLHKVMRYILLSKWFNNITSTEW